MILYLCVLALFSVLGTEACPAGWLGTDGGDFCYLVSQDPMSWFSAQQVREFVSEYLQVASTKRLEVHDYLLIKSKIKLFIMIIND